MIVLNHHKSNCGCPETAIYCLEFDAGLLLVQPTERETYHFDAGVEHKSRVSLRFDCRCIRWLVVLAI